MGFTEELADEVCAMSFADLAASTVATATMAIASSLAAAATAQQAAPVRIVRELVTERKSMPESQVWFVNDRVTMVDAARLNHMAADESMADDSALLNGSHLGSAVTAAALAVAEKTRATGPDVIAAVVCGYEAAIRIGRAEAELRAARHAHVSGLNAFGCGVAAAKLLGGGPEAMAHTLVLAATGTSGIDRVSTNDARSYQAGYSASVGVEAALAAYHGYRSATSVIDRYLDLIEFNGLPTGRTAAATKAADGRWAIDTELILKLRPGAFLYGSAVEASLRVVADNHITPAEIDRVTVRGHRFFPETDANRPLPAGSLAWYVASAMVRRGFAWNHFTDHYGDNDTIADLRNRVKIEPTSAADSPGSWGWAADVIVTTRDGSTSRSTVDLPPGSVVTGVDWMDVDAKAYELMGEAGIARARIDQILEAVKRLDTATDLDALTQLLRPVVRESRLSGDRQPA